MNFKGRTRRLGTHSGERNPAFSKFYFNSFNYMNWGSGIELIMGGFSCILCWMGIKVLISCCIRRN